MPMVLFIRMCNEEPNFAAPQPPPEIARTGFAGMGLLGLMGVVLLSGIGLLATPRRFS